MLLFRLQAVFFCSFWLWEEVKIKRLVHRQNNNRLLFVVVLEYFVPCTVHKAWLRLPGHLLGAVWVWSGSPRELDHLCRTRGPWCSLCCNGCGWSSRSERPVPESCTEVITSWGCLLKKLSWRLPALTEPWGQRLKGFDCKTTESRVTSLSAAGPKVVKSQGPPTNSPLHPPPPSQLTNF